MRLDVLIEGDCAGTVEILSDHGAVFSYVPAYLERPDRTPLSVRFPLREDPYKGPDVVHWLWNLLPDDNEVLKRWCLRYGAAPGRPLELLGTVLGTECAGAVQFSPPEKTADLLDAPGGLQEISDEMLWEGLRRLRRDWSFRFASTHGDAGRSLAGMQPKDALAWSGARWAVPWGRRATTHILKIGRRDFQHEVIVEHVTLEAARRLGLAAAESRVLHGEDFDAIIVRRFDRREADGDEGPERIHQEDFCQALGLAPGGRHQHFGGATVGDCTEIVAAFGVTAPVNVVRLRDNVLFRWLVADTDGHAKNVGILLSGGARALTPLYDAASLLPDRGTTEEGNLGFAMWGGEPWEVWTLGRTDTPEGLAALAGAVGFDTTDVASRAEEMAAALPAALEETINGLATKDQDKLDGLGFVSDVLDRAGRCEALAAVAQQPTPPRPSAPLGETGRSGRSPLLGS